MSVEQKCNFKIVKLRSRSRSQVRSRSGPRSGPKGPRTKDQRIGPRLTLNLVCHHHHSPPLVYAQNSLVRVRSELVKGEVHVKVRRRLRWSVEGQMKFR